MFDYDSKVLYINEKDNDGTVNVLQLSVGVEYALHCLLFMAGLPAGRTAGIKDLATYQGVSATYLSKVFTKLTKAKVVKSVPGVNGGYELARSLENITFWDIVAAVEGDVPFFRCVEIRQRELLLDKDNLPDSYTKCPCLIKTVMLDAEAEMRKFLSQKTLAWLYSEVQGKIPAEHSQATLEWFNNTKSR